MSGRLFVFVSIVAISVRPIFCRSIKQELAGNFINCQNVGAGVLDSNLLQTAPQTSEPLFGYYISKTAASPIDETIKVILLRDVRVDVEKASNDMKVPKTGRRWNTMYPAVVWCNNRWHTITRLIDEGGMGWSMSNYLITQTFNEKFEPTTSARLLGLPTFLNGVPYAGLEDPRLIVRDGHLFIQGNIHYPDMGMHDICRVGVFDAGTSTGYILEVPGHELYRWEKSWTGFIKDNALHYLYSLAPLVELECKDGGDCEVVYHQDRCQQPPCTGVSPRGNEGAANYLRGGTSLVPWNGSDSGYYVGFAHTNIGGDAWMQAMEGLEYRPEPPGVTFHKTHLFVYNARDHRIIYVSSPIVLGSSTLQLLSPKHNGLVQDPTSFVFTPSGTFVVGINLDDSHSVIAAVEGLVPVIEKAIRYDKGVEAPPAGPQEESDPDLLKCVMRVVKKYMHSVVAWR